MFHTPRRPISTGRFCSMGAVRKWRSMARAPARKRSKTPKPNLREMGRAPGEAQTE